MDFAQTDARTLMGTAVEIAAETAAENSMQSDDGLLLKFLHRPLL